MLGALDRFTRSRRAAARLGVAVERVGAADPRSCSSSSSSSPTRSRGRLRQRLVQTVVRPTAGGHRVRFGRRIATTVAVTDPEAFFASSQWVPDRDRRRPRARRAPRQGDRTSRGERGDRRRRRSRRQRRRGRRAHSRWRSRRSSRPSSCCSASWCSRWPSSCSCGVGVARSAPPRGIRRPRRDGRGRGGTPEGRPHEGTGLPYRGSRLVVARELLAQRGERLVVGEGAAPARCRSRTSSQPS